MYVAFGQYDVYRFSPCGFHRLPLLPGKLALFNSEFDSVVSAQGTAFRLNEAYKMAATLLSISPLLLMYAFVQRKFIEGIENTGITGE